jgi:hypothetical protein
MNKADSASQQTRAYQLLRNSAFRVKRTSRRHTVMNAIDPKRTLASVPCCHKTSNMPHCGEFSLVVIIFYIVH